MSELRVNNITNRDGKTGTVVAGIPQVSSTSHFVPPSGRTGQRYADGGENIVRDGLVLHLDAKYSYPSKTGITATTDSLDPDVYSWYDMSSNGFVGTVKSAVTYSSSDGGSLSFDDSGNNSVVNFGKVLSIGGPFTLEAWVNPSDISGSQNILSKGTNYWLHKENTDHTYRVKYQAVGPTDGTRHIATGITTAVPGTWANVSGTFDGENLKIYVNGSLEGTTATHFMPKFYDNSLFIGNYNSGTDGVSAVDGFDGKISIAKIYDRALTAAEVLQNYDALKDRFGL